MPRRLMLCTVLVGVMAALTGAGHRDGLALAGTATPTVAGMWEGTWSHRIGSGQITLRLAQEGTTVIGKQSVVGVVPVFDTRQQIVLGEDIRDGQLEDSLLMFHVRAENAPFDRVNFTLTVSGDTMTGTVCGYTCGLMKLKRSKL
jgi:hypothetical protein